MNSIRWLSNAECELEKYHEIQRKGQIQCDVRPLRHNSGHYAAEKLLSVTPRHGLPAGGLGADWLRGWPPLCTGAV